MRKTGLLFAATVFGFASHTLAAPRAKTQPVASGALQRKSSEAGTSPEGGNDKREASTTESKRGVPGLVFVTADRDRDGSVSFGEFGTLVRESIARRIAKRFRQLDRNHDGRCTRSEVNRMSAARFARLDLNRDGHFTLGELTTVFQSGLQVRLEHVYARLDTDADGRFSVAELTPPQPPRVQKVAARKPREVARRGAPSVQ